MVRVDSRMLTGKTMNKDYFNSEGRGLEVVRRGSRYCWKICGSTWFTVKGNRRMYSSLDTGTARALREAIKKVMWEVLQEWLRYPYGDMWGGEG